MAEEQPERLRRLNCIINPGNSITELPGLFFAIKHSGAGTIGPASSCLVGGKTRDILYIAYEWSQKGHTQTYFFKKFKNNYISIRKLPPAALSSPIQPRLCQLLIVTGIADAIRIIPGKFLATHLTMPHRQVLFSQNLRHTIGNLPLPL